MEGSVEDSGHAWPRQRGGAAARRDGAHRRARGQGAAAAATAQGASAIPLMTTRALHGCVPALLWAWWPSSTAVGGVGGVVDIGEDVEGAPGGSWAMVLGQRCPKASGRALCKQL